MLKGNARVFFYQMSETMAKMTSTVTVTEENYCLARPRSSSRSIVERSRGWNTNGIALLRSARQGPKDKTVMRANYDTMYSFARWT